MKFIQVIKVALDSNGLYSTANSVKQDLCNPFCYPPQIFSCVKLVRLLKAYGAKNKINWVQQNSCQLLRQLTTNFIISIQKDGSHCLSQFRFKFISEASSFQHPLQGKNIHSSLSNMANVFLCQLQKQFSSISNTTAKFLSSVDS